MKNIEFKNQKNCYGVLAVNSFTQSSHLFGIFTSVDEAKSYINESYDRHTSNGLINFKVVNWDRIKYDSADFVIGDAMNIITFSSMKI
ncbi:hypothetical protein [Virgibacillus senegalensis]|uniref:hypothetical protein n=1 Tax=Virgibacillus senegalensis TaxID=1499679 RepID=UPI00069F78F0|nr:hypothetical protein [Virgibacillus senegalensis]